LIDQEVLAILTAPKGQGLLPPCRSNFLQDLTIALGQRSIAALRSVPSITFEVQEEEIEGVKRFEDTILALASYRPGGGDYLYDADQMARILSAALKNLEHVIG
jgi:hypothetical protein